MSFAIFHLMKSIICYGEWFEIMNFQLICCYSYILICNYSYYAFLLVQMIYIHALGSTLFQYLLSLKQENLIFHGFLTLPSQLRINNNILVMDSQTNKYLSWEYIAHFALIIFGVFCNWLYNVIQNSSLGAIGVQFLFILIMMVLDLGVFFAIATSIELKALITVFFAYRILVLYYSVQFNNITTLAPIFFYLLHHSLAYLCKMYLSLRRTLYTSTNKQIQRQQQQKWQWKMRLISGYTFLFICSIVITFACNDKFKVLHYVIFILGNIFISNEIKSLNKIPSSQFSVCRRLLFLSYYFCIFQHFCVSYYFSGHLLSSIDMIFLFSLLSFVFLRFMIGIQTKKFDKNDIQYSKILYAFDVTLPHIYFKESFIQLRVLKVLDQLSREIARILYYLGSLSAIYSSKYLYLAFGTFIYLNYQIESDQILTFLADLVKKKVKFMNQQIKLNFKLLIPIILMSKKVYQVAFNINKRKYLLTCMTSCHNSEIIQIMLAMFYSILSFSVQFMPPTLKLKAMQFIKITFPLYIVILTIYFSCVGPIQLMLFVYVFLYCIQNIKNLRQKENTKKE